MAYTINKIYSRRKDGTEVLFDLEKRHKEQDEKIATNTTNITNNTAIDVQNKSELDGEISSLKTQDVQINNRINKIYDAGELPTVEEENGN